MAAFHSALQGDLGEVVTKDVVVAGASVLLMQGHKLHILDPLALKLILQKALQSFLVGKQ